ncbi:MAG: GGDEF domain-containing protein, partial [Novosphingobium sp.]
NRRAFEMFVGQSGGEGFVAMIDLDHFKRINDSFGHDCGDRVLKAFARAARAVLREDDVVARIGGEEFAVYLPGATLAQARLVCGRLTDALTAQAAPEVPKGWRVTASVGLAPLTGLLDAALKQADTALYQAKAAGRDRLAIAA